MRRAALLLVLLVAALGFAAAGCGGERGADPDSRDRRGLHRDGDEDTETTETETDGDRDDRHGDDRDRDDRDRRPRRPSRPGRRGRPRRRQGGLPRRIGLRRATRSPTPARRGPSARISTSRSRAELVVDRVTNGQGGMPVVLGHAQRAADRRRRRLRLVGRRRLSERFLDSPRDRSQGRTSGRRALARRARAQGRRGASSTRCSPPTSAGAR